MADVERPSLFEPIRDYFGNIVPVERLMPKGHPIESAGWPYSRVICQTCGAICVADHVLRGYIDQETRDYRAALNAAEIDAILAWRASGHTIDLMAAIQVQQDAVPAPAVEHFYPFTKWVDGASVDVNDEPAVDAPGPAPTPPKPRASTPPVVPAALAGIGPGETDVQQHRAHRRWDRESRGIPTTNVVHTKSKLGRTQEYKTIAERRRRARRKGMDPDKLGRQYQLPRRDTKAEAQMAATLTRTGLKAGLLGDD